MAVTVVTTLKQHHVLSSTWTRFRTISRVFLVTSGSGPDRSPIRDGNPLFSAIWTLHMKSTDIEARQRVANSWTTVSSVAVWVQIRGQDMKRNASNNIAQQRYLSLLHLYTTRHYSDGLPVGISQSRDLPSGDNLSMTDGMTPSFFRAIFTSTAKENRG